MGAGEQRRQARRGHPLLRGGGGRKQKEQYTHGFSASQMAALTALCATLVPSLPPPDRQNGHHSREQQEEDDGAGGKNKGADVEEFFRASAGDAPVPDEVAELMSRRCLPEALALVRTVLWLLGTRLGSLALCGAGLSWRFPFVRRFDELPLEAREAALRRWSRQTLLPPLRMFFLVTKVFCLYVFYSMACFLGFVSPPGILQRGWTPALTLEVSWPSTASCRMALMRCIGQPAVPTCDGSLEVLGSSHASSISTGTAGK